MEGHSDSSEWRNFMNSLIVSCVEYKKNIIVSGSHDRTLRVWIIEGALVECRHVLKGHRGYINCVAFDFDNNSGRIISGSRDKAMRYPKDCEITRKGLGFGFWSLFKRVATTRRDLHNRFRLSHTSFVFWWHRWKIAIVGHWRRSRVGIRKRFGRFFVSTSMGSGNGSFSYCVI